MENTDNCAIIQAKNVKVGDRVKFRMSSADYTVEEVEITNIGMVRHQHDSGSSTYWPNELLYIQMPTGRPIRNLHK